MCELSFEDVVYGSIGKIPKRYYRHTYREAAKLLKSYPTEVKNKLQSLKRITSSVKPVYVDPDIKVTGVRGTYAGYSLMMFGDTLSTTAKYVCNKRFVRTGKVVQKMGSVEKDVRVIFVGKGSYYTLTTKYKVSDPVKLDCSYEIYWRGRADNQVRTFNIALLDNRYKPVSEYPVSDAENKKLDIRPIWKEGISLYPEAPPPEIVIGYTYGLNNYLVYQDKKYMAPGFTIFLSYSFKNNTSNKVYRIVEYGVPLGVLYEDMTYASMIDYNISIPDVVLEPNKTTSNTISIVLPPWAYGHVFTALAFNVFDVTGGIKMLRYSGGPFLELDLFRLRTP